ncbi:MAG: ParA family protein, partial [Mesorhizobium sp.]
MPTVISAINGKGGAGKTTALMNIAGEYALRGLTVAMVDMDARSNLTKWWSDCREKEAQAEGIDVLGHKTAKAVSAFLDRAADSFDYVLIDTPGE